MLKNLLEKPVGISFFHWFIGFSNSKKRTYRILTIFPNTVDCSRFSALSVLLIVGQEGFEPPISASQAQRLNQLVYCPKKSQQSARIVTYGFISRIGPSTYRRNIVCLPYDMQLNHSVFRHTYLDWPHHKIWWSFKFSDRDAYCRLSLRQFFKKEFCQNLSIKWISSSGGSWTRVCWLKTNWTNRYSTEP